MAIALISALLIHVVWFARCFTHVEPKAQRRMRAAASLLSLALTAALFVLLQQQAERLLPLYLLGKSQVPSHSSTTTGYARPQLLDGHE